jgi:hypothetical protein
MRKWRGKWTERLLPGTGDRDFHAIHFPRHFNIEKRKQMPIRGSLKELKAAPERAIKLALIALIVATAALFISMGKKHG